MSQQLLESIERRLIRIEEALSNQTLSVKEVADCKGVSPCTIRLWVREGKLKPVNYSKPYRFQRSTILGK